jgi:DNA invertase Pin-like site-specific DNA recombinase
MNAILIARVSTEEQKEAGNSLPAQINRLEKYCRNKAFEILKTLQNTCWSLLTGHMNYL